MTVHPLQLVGNAAVQSVGTGYRNQSTHQLWDEINLTFNSVVYNDQMSTNFKESRGWLAWMPDDQRSHSQWESSHLSPTGPRSSLSAMAHPHLISRMTSSLHTTSAPWPGHWPTKTVGPSKDVRKGTFCRDCLYYTAAAQLTILGTSNPSTRTHYLASQCLLGIAKPWIESAPVHILLGFSYHSKLLV